VGREGVDTRHDVVEQAVGHDVCPFRTSVCSDVSRYESGISPVTVH
jgi:hypothetical protein